MADRFAVVRLCPWWNKPKNIKHFEQLRANNEHGSGPVVRCAAHAGNKHHLERYFDSSQSSNVSVQLIFG